MFTVNNNCGTIANNVFTLAFLNNAEQRYVDIVKRIREHGKPLDDLAVITLKSMILGVAVLNDNAITKIVRHDNQSTRLTVVPTGTVNRVIGFLKSMGIEPVVRGNMVSFL